MSDTLGETLVMVCDVDLDVPDGARTHTVELARGFATAGLAAPLIARGSDPRVAGVSYRSAAGSEHQRLRGVLTINTAAIAALWRERRRARRLYVRHKWSTMPATIVGRLLSYRVVSEVDDVPYGYGYASEIPLAVDYFKRLMTFLMGRLSHGVVAGTVEAKALLADHLGVPRRRIGRCRSESMSTTSGHSTGPRRSGEPASIRPSGTSCSSGTSPRGSTSTRCSTRSRWSRPSTPTSGCCSWRGARREQIEARARELGVGAALMITGYVHDRDRVRDLLASATVALGLAPR